jgi:hypothetical protein
MRKLMQTSGENDARPLIDLHMKIYRYEGLPSWSPGGKTIRAFTLASLPFLSIEF